MKKIKSCRECAHLVISGECVAECDPLEAFCNQQHFENESASADFLELPNQCPDFEPINKIQWKDVL